MTIKNERITTPKGYADNPNLSPPNPRFELKGAAP